MKITGKSPTEILKKEHQVVLKLLDNLDECIDENDAKSAGKNIAVLEEEFEKHSLNKEEKALFPEIEKFMPREGGPTGMMVIEHEQLTENLKNCKDALKTGNTSKFNENARNIIGLLRQHIEKEDNILFMMADMHLDDRQKKKILEKFKRFD